MADFEDYIISLSLFIIVYTLLIYNIIAIRIYSFKKAEIEILISRQKIMEEKIMKLFGEKNNEKPNPTDNNLIKKIHNNFPINEYATLIEKV